VQADPNNEDALLEQVRLLLQKKQYKQALDSLEKSHAQFPQKRQTAVMLTRLLVTSPVYELRNGTRALELARVIYKATGSIEHGALVSTALAELGLCAEAAEWQRKLIDAAQREQKTDLAGSLKRDLQLYESLPCRPAGQIVPVQPF
jgi:tetratricopeptide (TPR) repeat protein